MPDIRQYPTSHADMANAILGGFARLRAVPAAGTAVTPSPSMQSARPQPAMANDEAAIATGHRERRVLLAKRRAEQQIELTIEAWLRLGHVVTPEQARMLAGIAVAAYTDTLAHARR